jgi:CheY-like chemotaxis protein
VKKRILVAEDNEDMAIIMPQLLERLGYEVTVARDGLEAMEMATSQLPDLIVVDVMLPKIHGLQAAAQIRQNPKTKAIPILAITGSVMPGDQEKCGMNGFDGYIAKPFTFKGLKVAIEILLNGRGQRRSARRVYIPQTS